MSKLHLTGTLTCAPHEAPGIAAALEEHIRLTRQEPGCERFDVTQSAPGVFELTERFTNRAAFDAHQTRSRDSDWFALSGGLERNFVITEE